MRTTGVKLEAETAGYKRGVEDAAKSTRGLKDDVEGLGTTSTTTGRKVDGLGDNFRGTGRDAKRLKDEIQSLERSLAGLAVEFAATSSESERLDLTKSIRKQQGEMRQLLKVQKLLPDPEPAGQSFASKLMTGIGDGLSKTPITGMLTVPIAAVAVAVAPIIGAAISGAVIGGAGIGGVMGGLLLVSKDARVEAAGKALGTRLLGALQQDSSVFIGPALAGIDQLGAAFDKLRPHLQNVFANASKFVKPLTDGLVGFLDPVVSGFDKLVAKAAPVIEAIRQGFGQVGQAIGGVFASLADNGKEAALALSIVFNGISAGIKIVGAIINGLTETFGWLIKLASATGFLSEEGKKKLGAFEKATDGAKGSTESLGISFQVTADKAAVLKRQHEGLKVVNDEVKSAQDALKTSLDSLGGSTSLAGQRSSALKTAMDNLYGATIRQADANQTYQESWDNLSTAVKGNSHSLDVHTQAGRTNRTALIGLVSSNNDLYVADIAAGMSVAQATKKHEARTEAVRKESIKLGLNKTKTQELINTYGRIPGKKTTELVLDGLRSVVAALNRLYIYQRALAEGKSTTSIEQSIRTGSDRGASKPGGGFAAGGQIGGWSPNSRADNIPAMLTAREYVHPVDSVDYYGVPVMDAIRRRQVPREVLSAFATGALGRMGDLPFFASGGQVAPVDTSRRWRFPADMSGTHIPSMKQVAAKVGGPGAAFVRAQDGKPYVWASAGPGGYDCSGIVSAVYNVLHGRNPYSHTFSTGSLPGHWFTKPGVGGPLTAAWSNPGQSPASSTTGHMMGMVGGLTFESSGSRGVHLGSSTRRLSDFAHIAHYGQGGGVAMDNGGFLQPGWNPPIYNGTGEPEPIIPARYITGGDGGRSVTVNVTFSGPVGSPYELQTWLAGAVDRLKAKGRI